MFIGIGITNHKKHSSIITGDEEVYLVDDEGNLLIDEGNLIVE